MKALIDSQLEGKQRGENPDITQKVHKLVVVSAFSLALWGGIEMLQHRLFPGREIIETVILTSYTMSCGWYWGHTPNWWRTLVCFLLWVVPIIPHYLGHHFGEWHVREICLIDDEIEQVLRNAGGKMLCAMIGGFVFFRTWEYFERSGSGSKD